MKLSLKRIIVSAANYKSWDMTLCDPLKVNGHFIFTFAEQATQSTSM
jgi:hypothetical protein